MKEYQKAILIASTLFCFSLTGHAQRITLIMNNVTVKQAMMGITKVSGYTFVFSSRDIDSMRRVSVSASNSGLNEVMRQVLKGQHGISYEIQGRKIVLSKRTQRETRSGTQSVSEEAPHVQQSDRLVRITGTVVDEKGEPMIGATVMESSSKKGTITDFNGKFILNISGGKGKTLQVSYVGYVTKDVSASGDDMHIALEPISSQLEEVVVVGYGTMKKRDLTGSIVSVKAEDIVKSPASNAMEALQGQVPGLDITRNSGKATSGVTISIRGQRSLSDVKDEFGNNVANAPLFIIDGMQGGNMADISPSDIESIEVLKDASSTAIYGSQGANGVIIITTKRGVKGKVKVSYNGYFGINGMPQYPDMLTGEGYMQVRREAARTAGQWNSVADDQKLFTSEEWEAIQNREWTDWIDKVFHTGLVQSHQITAAGGSERTNALVSAGYYQEKGSFKNDEMKRYNLRMNVDHKLSDMFKVGATMQATHYAQDERAENVLWRAATNAPLGKAYDDNGKVVEWPLGKNGQVSPLVDEASENIARHHVLKTNLVGNGYLEFKPIRGLTFRSNLGINYLFYRNQEFEGASSIDRLGQYSTSESSVVSSEKSFVNWDNVLNYNITLKDKHTIGATALTSWTQSKYTSVNALGQGQLVDSYLYHNLGANNKDTYVIGSNYIQHQTFSYALRFNYSYMGKYMLTVSNRWDGDSRLSTGNKWASFPSVALAWRMNEERFLRNVAWLSNLKLRLSWGKTGNSGIMAYGTQSGLTPKTNSAYQDNGYTYYIFNEYIGNKNVGWEISKTWDLGLDIGLLTNRVSAVIDIYKTNTSDILLPRTLPTTMGGSNANPFKMYQNIGATMNRGIEIALNTVNIITKDFRWSSSLTFAANHEEITELLDGKDIIGEPAETNSLLLGRPLHSFRDYVNLGIWQEHEKDEAATYFKDTKKQQSFKPGDIKIKDLNGDRIIDENDKTYIGSTSPKWSGGFSNNFIYKNFDMTVYVIARWGQMINYELGGSYDPQGKSNFPAYLNYWTPENPSNDYPRPNQTNFYNYLGYHTLSYIDGSYWKLKTISLGYSFPERWMKRVGVSKLRVYVTANNLFSFAKNHLIQDYDAERGGSAKAPLQRQFIFGVNLDF